MNDDVAQLLASLRLSKIADILDDEIKKAEKEDLSYSALIGRLLRAQWNHRQESALGWRIKQAKLPEEWS